MEEHNYYLYIGEVENSKLKIESYDGIFLSCTTKSKENFADYCKGMAENFRHSTLGNYNHLSIEEREELAKRWENAANLGVGQHDYYFNLENKEKIFKQYIEEFAECLGIKYKLTIIK